MKTRRRGRGIPTGRCSLDLEVEGGGGGSWHSCGPAVLGGGGRGIPVAGGGSRYSRGPGRGQLCPWEYHDPGPLPKGPFRTKNTTALESVVFCYRRSFLLSIPFSCLFFLEKQALLSTLRSGLLSP